MVRRRIAAAAVVAALAWPARVAARPYEGPTAVEGPDAPVTSVGAPKVPPVASEPEPEPLAPIEDVEPDDYDALRDSPEAVDARNMTRGGAVLTATAVALGIGALAMGLSDPCTPQGGNSCLDSARDRAALTMGVPGIAMLAGGIALLAVGARRKARLRASAAASRRGVGLAAVVQF